MQRINNFFRQHIQEFVIFILSFISLSLILRYIIVYYFPTGDDISLIVNSTGFFKALNPLGWFTEGYADYFRVYPEWSVHSKEIVRPFANIFFYINSLIFGKNFNLYLYLNIFVHSLGVSLVFYICNKYLRINLIFSYLASFIFFFTPAVLNRDYFFFSSFVLDALVSVFIFISFMLSIHNKKILPFIFAFAALLTKETALFVPLAVAFTLYINSEDKKKIYFVFGFLVILIWFVYRKLIGVDISVGLDVISTWKVYFVNIARGLLIWFSGVPDNTILSNNFFPFILFVILVNISIFISLIIDIYKELKTGNRQFAILLIWIISLYPLLIFFGLESRFGYSLHLFFIPLIIYFLFKNNSVIRKIVYSIFCIWIFISGVLFFSNILNSKAIESYKLKMQNAVELNNLLNNAKKDKVLFINDVSSFFGTPSLSDFSESKKEIIKINSLANYDFQKFEENKASNIKVENMNDTVDIKVIIPEYTKYWFEGVKPELFNHQPVKYFKRNSNISYQFHDEEEIGVSKLTGIKKIDFGRSLHIKTTGIDFSIIWFNPSYGKYEIIEY